MLGFFEDYFGESLLNCVGIFTKMFLLTKCLLKKIEYFLFPRGVM